MAVTAKTDGWLYEQGKEKHPDAPEKGIGQVWEIEGVTPSLLAEASDGRKRYIPICNADGDMRAIKVQEYRPHYEDGVLAEEAWVLTVFLPVHQGVVTSLTRDLSFELCDLAWRLGAEVVPGD